MTRTLGASIFGVVTVATQFAFIASTATRFGMDVANVRLVAILMGRGETARVRGKTPLNRPPLDYDLEEVFRQAARTGTALEVNSFPDRLDLNDEHILWARRHGVKFAVDTDSHSTVHLEFMRFGVGMAQRGWLTKEDVINAWPLTRLRKFLRKGRA